MQNLKPCAKSEIQNPKSRRTPLFQNWRQNPSKPEIQNPKSAIKTPKSKSRNPKHKNQNHKSNIRKQNDMAIVGPKYCHYYSGCPAVKEKHGSLTNYLPLIHVAASKTSELKLDPGTWNWPALERPNVEAKKLTSRNLESIVGHVSDEDVIVLRDENWWLGVPSGAEGQPHSSEMLKDNNEKMPTL